MYYDFDRCNGKLSRTSRGKKSIEIVGRVNGSHKGVAGGEREDNGIQMSPLRGERA